MPVPSPIPTAVVGVTGYEGANLARLLAAHPHFALIEATARREIGVALGRALPALAGLPCADIPITESVREAALVFIAAPHGPAGEIAAACRRAGRRVIDLSADFRLRDPAQYTQWYGHAHPAPELLPAAYGLCEWQRAAIREADLIANPGCFPTAAILALAPALAARMIQPAIIVDAKTAISGAGRSPARRVHFSETHDSTAPYGLGGHRHLPEMVNLLTDLAPASDPPQITFVPHLVPMSRGILATCYVTLQPGISIADLAAAYEARYAGEPFVEVIARPPETAWVRGSNRCLIHIAGDAVPGRAIIISAIDNLMKGGAGQAIQNANLRYGLPETAGLEMGGLWP
jgi:N-acetyl-gamma-glutamyl-phosphate reductase